MDEQGDRRTGEYSSPSAVCSRSWTFPAPSLLPPAVNARTDTDGSWLGIQVRDGNDQIPARKKPRSTHTPRCALRVVAGTLVRSKEHRRWHRD